MIGNHGSNAARVAKSLSTSSSPRMLWLGSPVGISGRVTRHRENGVARASAAPPSYDLPTTHSSYFLYRHGILS
jgi:hypothetical protein